MPMCAPMRDMFDAEQVELREIVLRDYQADAIEALRDGIRCGKRRQVLVAGTGAGKTVIASHLLREANRKGSYSLFLVDRVSLVDQTSATLESYGIEHGVVQADHPRWEPRLNVQVCSIQTLRNRSLPRKPSLIVWDEVHIRSKAMQAYLDSLPDCVKIGLTATPFTKGMGNDWDRAVNVRTTRALINDGYLVEPTIYVAKGIDDAKLERDRFGEFTERSAGQAGIEIVGDVVAEWVKKTREHFGGPVKTIVFTATVDHGRELCAAFAAAGYNFQQISYLDKDDGARRDKIAEFRRPDSLIHGLVSCGVLTRGFDVPDVQCGISCRPYRKSLSSHIQEIGRVMRPYGDEKRAIWLCLAKDSKVLTDRGLVSIQFVTKHDKVWDGENFVSHGGAICKGVQNVITYQGLTATPGHLVHTMDGWRTFGDCARQQIPITQTGFGRTAIRIGQDCLARGAVAGTEAPQVHSCHLRMRDLWVSLCRFSQQFAGWAHQRLSNLQSAAASISSMALCAGAGSESPMRQSEEWHVSRLWRPRNRVSVFRRKSGDALGHGEPRGSRRLQIQGFGPHQHGRALRAGQHSLVGASSEFGQSVGKAGYSENALVSVAAPRGSLCGSHDEATYNRGPDFGRNTGSLESINLNEREAEVWDILDAGPRNRFTCNGLLVHNCHSGNIERFALDMFDVWDNGAGELDHSTTLDGKARERTPMEREKVVCPECSGALRGNTCTACGWERPARSGVSEVAGELHEFSRAAMSEPRAGLRAECLKDPRKVWDAALDYCMMSTSRGENAARKWAYGIWRGVYPSAKLPWGWFDAPRAAMVDPSALDLVAREVRRFRKRRKTA